jgi:3-dehydroquinate synthase class II
MKYPHTCTITRTAETISATGGVPVAGATSTLYSGKCDAQENTRPFAVQAGIVTSKGSATVFLPDGKVESLGIRTGDSVTITWANGNTKSGRVDSTVNLDDTLLVLYG